MALGARLHLKQTQSLKLTPELKQAIEILQMAGPELDAFVEKALEQNPLLERAETSSRAERESDITATDETGEAAFEIAAEALDTPSDALYPEASTGGGEDFDFERLGASDPSLHEFLEAGLSDLSLSSTDRAAAHELIGALSDAGYLGEALEDMAMRLAIPADRLDSVRLRLARHFEPAGLFALSVRDCLGLQLEARDRLDPAMQAALNRLDLVAARDFAGLKKATGLDDDDIADLIREILSLDPKPGLVFAPRTDTELAAPDILVSENADGSFGIELNPDVLPKVLVSERTYRMAKAATRSAEERAYLTETYAAASWLKRSLNQRAETLLSVAGALVAKQESYFREGITALKPLTLQMIAEEIGLHESTVSRAAMNKTLVSKRGVQPLKFFFSAKLQAAGDEGEAHAANAIRHRIKALIDKEDPQKVLSDDKITALLKADGIVIARRTVAKYRESLEIPPSSVRRRHKKVAL